MIRGNRAIVLAVLVALLVAVLVGVTSYHPPGAGEARGITNFDSVEVSSWLIADPQTALTVITSTILSPTGTYQPISAAAAYTLSETTAIYSGTVSGQLLMLRNSGSYDIVVPDGANTVMTTTVTLGPGDILSFIWNGTDWTQTGDANNE